MEQYSFSIPKLKECHEKGDSNGILSTLIELKKHLRGAKNVSDVDREAFQILVNLIKYPNSKIMDISMSILANCCLRDSHREMFKDFGGIPHLILVLKTVDNDNILCRACRLLGNLASNRGLAVILNEYNAGFLLLKSLETISTKSTATAMMTFRAIKKLWSIKSYQHKMLPEDVSNILNICLKSTDDQLVKLSIETLTLFSTHNGSQTKNSFQVSKELLEKLVELYKEDSFKALTINCLSNLICYKTNQVWKHLEGSGLPETFINYIQNVDNVNKVVLEAFYKLCTEGAVRNKVKNAGLLPKLLKLCCDSNIDKMLLIFYLFQFDTSSIAILAQNKDFLPLLTRNITKNGAVRLLSVVSTLDPPVKELLSDENLNIIIKHKECHGILKSISQKERFLTQLIASGRIWEISEVDCLSEVRDGYAEQLLVHLIRTGEKNEIENAALALPFLVKPRYFTWYDILARNNGITIILRLLRERTLEERILATIVKLINIFQNHFSNNYKHSRRIFENALTPSLEIKTRCSFEVPEFKTELTKDNEIAENNSKENSNTSDAETVSFMLDCGSVVTVRKNVFCRSSPVLDAMLNGHFIESKQQQVKLSCCSSEGLHYLEGLLTKEVNVSEIKTETYLELISLTDRFLMSNLNDMLTDNLRIDESSCVAVLRWCRDSGYTKNNGIIKEKAFEFVFSSSSRLLLAMKNETLRTPLVNDISDYLSGRFVDLL